MVRRPAMHLKPSASRGPSFVVRISTPVVCARFAIFMDAFFLTECIPEDFALGRLRLACCAGLAYPRTSQGDAQVFLYVVHDVYDHLHLHHRARHQGYARRLNLWCRIHHLPQGPSLATHHQEAGKQTRSQSMHELPGRALIRFHLASH